MFSEKLNRRKIAGEFMSFRVPLMQWLSKPRFDELLRSLKKYRQAVDELAFFSSFIHPVLPLETIKERMEIVGQRIAAAKNDGYRAGINFLNTLGHCDEYLDDALKGTYTRITGINGNIAHGSFCPNDEKFRKYVRQVYTYAALAKPDFIWLDDDIRLDNHKPVKFGCFCDQCLQLFSVKSGCTYTRETLREAFNSGNLES